MKTIEERAFASMVTRKREQIDNKAPKEKFMCDVYMNGFKNGANEVLEEACKFIVESHLKCGLKLEYAQQQAYQFKHKFGL